MNIAIQGHSTRGKEVIQILESLGGINRICHGGNFINYFYYISSDDNTIAWTCIRPQHINVFTLEEFEKEFPFKVGDKVKHITSICTIRKYCYINNKPAYEVKSMELGVIAHIPVKMLEPYKEMKEERNITLTLEKAKEWYKKGGELREVALQAYSEEELTKIELPKTWEEFCANYPIQAGEAIIDEQTSQIRRYNGIVARCLTHDKNVYTSQKSAEAHLAMIQLEQLRDCYNNNSDAWGWSYSIIKRNRIPELIRGCDHDTFLRFKNEEIATQFLKCFKDLIEKAGDLI